LPSALRDARAGTTDGDLAVDPALLDDAAELEEAMRAAGFELSLVDGHVEPGARRAACR
jgi:hypothetical protein